MWFSVSYYTCFTLLLLWSLHHIYWLTLNTRWMHLLHFKDVWNFKSEPRQMLLQLEAKHRIFICGRKRLLTRLSLIVSAFCLSQGQRLTEIWKYQTKYCTCSFISCSVIEFLKGSKWLTVVHEDQSELIFGPTILKLRCVRTLIPWTQLIEQYLHQTFSLGKIDLAVLPRRKDKKYTADTVTCHSKRINIKNLGW